MIPDDANTSQNLPKTDGYFFSLLIRSDSDKTVEYQREPARKRRDTVTEM